MASWPDAKYATPPRIKGSGFWILVFGFWLLVFVFWGFGLWSLVFGSGIGVWGFEFWGCGFGSDQLLHRVSWVPVPGLEFGLNPPGRFKKIKINEKTTWREEGTEV